MSDSGDPERDAARDLEREMEFWEYDEIGNSPARSAARRLLIERIRSTGEIGAFSFGLTLVEGAQLMAALNEPYTPPARSTGEDG